MKLLTNKQEQVKKKLCSIRSCDKHQVAKGYCQKHYDSWRRKGDPLAKQIQFRQNTICKVAKCNNKPIANNLCHKHYKRIQVHGSIELPKKKLFAREKECIIDGCNKKQVARNYCGSHWKKWRRYGDPNYTPEKTINYVNKQGYIRLHKPGYEGSNSSNYIYEHRYIMAEIIGRPLKRNEHVHHKNGDRKDNRPLNLELWVKSQPAGQRVKDLVNWAHEIINEYEDLMNNQKENGNIKKTG